MIIKVMHVSRSCRRHKRGRNIQPDWPYSYILHTQSYCRVSHNFRHIKHFTITLGKFVSVLRIHTVAIQHTRKFYCPLHKGQNWIQKRNVLPPQSLQFSSQNRNLTRPSMSDGTLAYRASANVILLRQYIWLTIMSGLWHKRCTWVDWHWRSRSRRPSSCQGHRSDPVCQMFWAQFCWLSDGYPSDVMCETYDMVEDLCYGYLDLVMWCLQESRQCRLQYEKWNMQHYATWPVILVTWAFIHST